MKEILKKLGEYSPLNPEYLQSSSEFSRKNIPFSFGSS